LEFKHLIFYPIKKWWCEIHVISVLNKYFLPVKNHIYNNSDNIINELFPGGRGIRCIIYNIKVFTYDLWYFLFSQAFFFLRESFKLVKPLFYFAFNHKASKLHIHILCNSMWLENDAKCSFCIQ